MFHICIKIIILLFQELNLIFYNRFYFSFLLPEASLIIVPDFTIYVFMQFSSFLYSKYFFTFHPALGRELNRKRNKGARMKQKNR